MTVEFIDTVQYNPLQVNYHSLICLTTSPQPLPKRVHHRMRYSSSSFNLQYLLISLRSSNNCLRLLPRPPRQFYPSLYLSFSNAFRTAVPTQHVTNPATLGPFHCIQDIPLLLYCVVPLHFSHNRSKLSSPTICSTTLQHSAGNDIF